MSSSGVCEHPWFGVRASHYPVHSDRQPYPIASVPPQTFCNNIKHGDRHTNGPGSLAGEKYLEATQ